MSKINSLPHKTIGVAVIWNQAGEILIDRRRAEGLLGGLWEFPGGKVEQDETIEDCIKREIQEELGIDIEVGDRLITVEHSYSHFNVTLIVHHCRHLTGVPQPIECDEIRWVTLDEIERFSFPQANSQIIAALRPGEKVTGQGEGHSFQGLTPGCPQSKSTGSFAVTPNPSP